MLRIKLFLLVRVTNIYVNIGMKKEKTSVILAGANPKIFNTENNNTWNRNSPLKIVTHHWSSHKNKGFDIYKKLDEMVNKENWKNRIEFTYIGNMNNDYTFSHSNIVKPLAGYNLSAELKKHHLYVTASINEPSGNHHIEAAQCAYRFFIQIAVAFLNIVMALVLILITIILKVNFQKLFQITMNILKSLKPTHLIQIKCAKSSLVYSKTW